MFSLAFSIFGKIQLNNWEGNTNIMRLFKKIALWVCFKVIGHFLSALKLSNTWVFQLASHLIMVLAVRNYTRNTITWLSCTCTSPDKEYISVIEGTAPPSSSKHLTLPTSPRSVCSVCSILHYLPLPSITGPGRSWIQFIEIQILRF